MKFSRTLTTLFLSSSAFVTPGLAQDCGQIGLPAGCEPPTAGDTIVTPIGVNAERDEAPIAAPEGFVISINGEALIEDEEVTNVTRQTDVALAAADVQVRFDGLDIEPRLDLERVGADEPAFNGDTVTYQSSLNYPAFVERAELRIIDTSSFAGQRTVGVVPIAPNGQASVTLPLKGTLSVVHRVYDSAGRFDETAPLPIEAPTQSGQLDGVEEGIDTAIVRRIPVTGGAVTVYGQNVAPGASVTALGEQIRPAPGGDFVIQRILPAGDYPVNVQINGGGQRPVDLTRAVEVPASDWFYVATADVTLGYREDPIDGDDDVFETGRLAFFVNGQLANGTRITASADTQEGPLEDLIRDLDERDPRQLLLRVDPDDLYPTFGDDSSIEDLTPTSGKLFLRVEREGSFLQWGDFHSTQGDNEYVRNDRTLYGLQVRNEARAATIFGDPKTVVTAYAAQPDRLPQRDVFQSTGGSVFFLERQDVQQASETIFVQLRDDDTDRIIETIELVPGQDYDINYIQGIVTLARPLFGETGPGLIGFGGEDENDVVLVVQYEFTPSAGDVDGFAYGGRAEHWVSDTLRVGVAGQLDETGVSDHQVLGGDVLWQLSEDSFARLDYAESDGTGFDNAFSADAGLIFDTETAASGNGRAVRAEFRVSLADFDTNYEGYISGYYEDRTEGFSSLDTQVTDVTGDETLFGFVADVALTDQWGVRLTYDDYKTDAGDVIQDAEVDLTYTLSSTLRLAVGVGYENRETISEDGDRTDAAASLTYKPNDDTVFLVFGQATVDAGGLERDDRIGVGTAYKFAPNWTLEGEVSQGSLGTGARVLLSRTDDVGNTRYLGYDLTPGRDIAGVSLDGNDMGRVVAGGRQTISERVDMFGETSFDVFGRHQTLTSVYGITYRPTDFWTTSVGVELANIEDGAEFDFDRQAVTLGATYADEFLEASGRLEYRVEDGVLSGSDINTDSFLLSSSGTYKFSEEARVVFRGDYARSRTNGAPLLDGDYTDVSLGYAFRPITNDRFNMLARYRYLNDQVGQRLDDVDEDGPVQRSHVLSVDGIYDLTRNWSIGGKVGYRSADTAANSETDFQRNNATLLVGSAEYHLVHDWDALLEFRHLDLSSADTSETGVLGAVYKSVGNNFKVGVGYNWGRFSDDLTDLTMDDQGAFINLIAKF